MSFNGRRGRSPAQNVNRGSPRGGSRGRGRGQKRMNRSFDSNPAFFTTYNPDDLHERKKLNKKKRRHSLETFTDLYSDINVNFKDCFRIEESPSQTRKYGKKHKQKPRGPVLIPSAASSYPPARNSSSPRGGNQRGSNQRGSYQRGRGGRGNPRGNRRGGVQPQVYYWDYTKDDKEEKEVPPSSFEVEKAKLADLVRENAKEENETELNINIIATEDSSSSEESESESESSGSEGIEDDEEDAEFDLVFGTNSKSVKQLEEALGAVQGEILEELSGESSDYSYDDLDDEQDDDLVVELNLRDKESKSSTSKHFREEYVEGSDDEDMGVEELDENDSGTDEEALADYMENTNRFKLWRYRKSSSI